MKKTTKKSKMAAYTSEYAMRGSDNAVTRDEINASITSSEMSNEHSYTNALKKGLDDIIQQ
jgi:hypothetical protein